VWLPDNFRIPSEHTIVVVDDDPSIHNFWHTCLQGGKQALQHFLSYQEVISWYKSNQHTHLKVIFLVDYELNNSTHNGLELLRVLDAKENGYLVTSYAEEVWLQQDVEKLGVWLIPKSLLKNIPVIFTV
jgi:CheY-like chemotaxis protein